MVLTQKHAEVTPKGFLAQREYNSFMVLNTTSILYEEETKLFGFGIEILNLIRVINKANKLAKDFKSEFRIETEIFYKAMNSVLTNEAFTDGDLTSYFSAEQTKEEFLTFSRSLANIENDFYLPFELDFILLGMDIDLYEKLDEADKDVLSESYGNIHYDVIFKKIEISDFILQAKKILVDLMP